MGSWCCLAHWRLAEQTPALFLAFDLLKKGKTQLGPPGAFPLSFGHVLVMAKIRRRSTSCDALACSGSVSREIGHVL